MTIDLSAYQRAFSASPTGVTAAEVNAERMEETTVHVRHGELAGSEAFDRVKLYVRVTGQKTGMVYTEKLDEDADAVIAKAYANADFATSPLPEPMNEGRTEQLSCPRDPASIQDMIAFGAAAEAALPAGNVADLSVTLNRRELRTVNSLGLDVSSETGYAEAVMMVTIQRESGVAEGEARVSAKTLNELNPEILAIKAFAAANAMDGGGLKPVSVLSGEYTCVVSGQVMRNIFMTAWQTFSAASIQRGASSVKQVGEQVGSAAFSVRNVPSHPLVGEAWLMDSEGTRVAFTSVVKAGVLTHPLHTLISAREANASSTGSAGRVARMTGDVPITLTTVPSLIYVESGTESQEDLVRRMGSGLLLTYSLDLYHSVNVASGEFSVPCGGVLYEKGKPVGSVSQITMSGNVLDLWRHIVSVGNDLDFDPFYFKTYSVGSPSALITGVTIAS